MPAPLPPWAEPGAHPVAPGVHRLPLPLPGDGLRAVNVYAVEDGDGLTLVDAGWHREDSRSALDSALAEIGGRVADIRQVVVTHIHHDHFGQAAALRRDSGARVLLGAGEKRSLDAILGGDAGFDAPARRVRLVRHGAAALADEVDAAMAGISNERQRGRGLWEPPDAWLADGETVHVGGRALDAIATPGHTRGHVSLLDAGAGLLFAGDHVLPHISPSIGFEPLPGGLPLVDFILSLVKVRDLPVRLVLPAHGDIFTGLSLRVEELLGHHAGRLAACRGALAPGGSTALEVAELLPWTRRERRFVDLDLFNRVLAVEETAAHLDLLVVQGSVAAVDVGPVRSYRRPDPAASN